MLSLIQMLIYPFHLFAQCSGIELRGNIGSVIYNSFDSYEKIQRGEVFTDFITMQYLMPNGTSCQGWKLKVRALGNFTNGSASIAPQFVSIRFGKVAVGPPTAEQMGVSNESVALSTSDATLIHSKAAFVAPPTYFASHKFDMIVQGGSHLLVGSGTYSAILTFSFYDANDQLVSSTNVKASFNVLYSSSCAGLSLNAYTSYPHRFTTYEGLMAGATVTEGISIQYNTNGANCRGWTLKARLSGDFSNGSNNVAPQYFSLKFNRVSSGVPSASAIGVSNNPITLGTTDIVLINQSNASFNGWTEHKFDMMIQGGFHLLIPNGTYVSSLIFSVYNQSNELVATFSTPVTFLVYATLNSYTLVLQNSANQVSMAFNTVSDYTNGISVSKLRGLKVSGTNPYQVLVRTAGFNLRDGQGSNVIAVEAVNLEIKKFSHTADGINCFTKGLSVFDQVFVTNPLSDPSQKVVEFDMKYFTKPGDKRFSKPAGIYSTSVLFVAIPL